MGDIIIEVKGGMVQNVYSRKNDVAVEVFYFDTDDLYEKNKVEEEWNKLEFDKLFLVY